MANNIAADPDAALGAFDHLIPKSPDPQSAAGTFDHLIPKAPDPDAALGAFDHLIPEGQGAIVKNVRSVVEAPIRFERGLGQKIGDVAAGSARVADMARRGELLQGVQVVPRFSALSRALTGNRSILGQPTAGERERFEQLKASAIERQKRLEEESGLYQWGREQTEMSGKVFAGSSDIDDTFVSELAVAAGGMMPDIMAAAIPVVGPSVSAASYGLQAGQMQAQEAVDAGRPDTADVAFVAAAGLGAGSERLIGFAPRFWKLARASRQAKLPPEKFGGAISNWLAKNPGKAAALEGLLRESVQESSEQAGQNVIARDLAGYDPERKLSQGVARSGAVGGVLGLAGGGAAHVVGEDAARRAEEAAFTKASEERANIIALAESFPEQRAESFASYFRPGDVRPIASVPQPASVPTPDDELGTTAGAVAAPPAPAASTPRPPQKGAAGANVPDFKAEMAADLESVPLTRADLPNIAAELAAHLRGETPESQRLQSAGEQGGKPESGQGQGANVRKQTPEEQAASDARREVQGPVQPPADVFSFEEAKAPATSVPSDDNLKRLDAELARIKQNLANLDLVLGPQSAAKPVTQNVPAEVQSAATEWRAAEKRWRRAKRQDPSDVEDATIAREEAELNFRALAEKSNITQQQFDKLSTYAKELDTDQMAEAEEQLPAVAGVAQSADAPENERADAGGGTVVAPLQVDFQGNVAAAAEPAAAGQQGTGIVKAPAQPALAAGEQVGKPVSGKVEAPPATPAKPMFSVGQRVAVKLSNRSAKEHMARITQLQPDGSAQVQVEGEKVQRWVKADQLMLTKADRARADKAEEMASIPEAQREQVKADALEFDRVVEEYAPQLDWAPAEAYDRNTAMQEQGIENARLRRVAQERAMAAVMPEGQANSMVDKALALPKLEAFLRGKFPGDNSIAKRRALEQFKATDEQAPAPTERAKADRQALRRIAAENPGVRELQNLVVAFPVRGASGPAGRVDGKRAGPRRVSAAEAHALAQLDRIFGTQTILVDSPTGEPLPFYGFKDKRSGVVLLHTRGDLPLLTVMGHELSHHLMLRHAALYQEAMDALLPLIPAEKLAAYKERLRKRGQATNDRAAYQELIGDFMGDNFARPEFWRRLAQREPNLFQRLGRVVKQWLDKLLAKIKAIPGYDSEQYFSDVERARDEIENLLVQAGREAQYRKANITEGETSNIQHPTSNIDGEFSKAENDFFGAPESVTEQRERVRREKAQKAQADQRQTMIERANARLTGADIDTTSEMFAGSEGRTTRQDKAGQGSLFSKPDLTEAEQAELDQIAQDLYRKPYDELTEFDQGNVQVTFEHERAAQARQADIKRGRELFRQDLLRAEAEAGEVSTPPNAGRESERSAPSAEPAAGEPVRPVRSAATRAETARQRYELAREIFRKPYPHLLDEAQAHVREELARGRRPAEVVNDPIEQRLRDLWDERARQEERFRYAGKGANGKLTERGEMLFSKPDSASEVEQAARGELEAYHGSPEGTFQTFRESARGTFFTNKPDLAEGYTAKRGIWRSPGSSPKVYHARLTMLNPLVIEAGGARNNNIPFPGQEYKRTVFGNLPANAVNIESAAAKAFSRGHDGVIIRDVMDSSDVTDKTRSTVYVVKAPSQVQPAQGGAFSKPEGAAAELEKIQAAERELMAAIQAHMAAPIGAPERRELRAAKSAAALKLRQLQFSAMRDLTSPMGADVARTPEQTREMISETVDLLNAVEEEMSQLKAHSETIPPAFVKMRNDLRSRLQVLKGWAQDVEAEMMQGDKAPETALTVPQRVATRRRQMEVESATNPQNKTLADWWATMKRGLRYLASPIPELPLLGEKARGTAAFRRGYRLFATETEHVKQAAAEKINKVLEPIVNLGRTTAQNDRLAEYTRLGTALQRAEMDEKKAERIATRMAELERDGLDQDPFNLFRKTVLYRDLWWRASFLKTPDGKPVTLPNGLDIEDVAAELRRLSESVAKHPHGAAIREAIKRHTALTNELQESILNHGEIIPEALRNPFYFPHHTLDNWTGSLDRVRPSTEEDFRRYLIAPVGSGKLIQADYLKAMFLHTADVLAHNARVDLVEKYWKSYDISERLKEEHGEAWDKPWNLPAGIKLFAPYKKLPLRLEYILSREVLADKLGVLFNDGDLSARAKEAGAVLKVAPEDLHAAMVAGEKIKWALPAEIVDALEGIAKRERARSNPGTWHGFFAPVRGLIGFWKRIKLFLPTNWIRYEYGNLTTDVIDKVLVADPKIATYWARAQREIRDGSKPGEKSPEFKAAAREGVFDTVTAGEAGLLERLPAFEAFQTTKERRLAGLRKFAESTTRMSRFREGVFRYAKFLADVERMRAGQEPVYAGAFHRDIKELNQTPQGQGKMLEGDEVIFAKAAEISLKTFGDYQSLSVAGQGLRTYLIPFWSWQDVNFRYHANQLRNIADGLRGVKGASEHKTALRYAAVRVVSTLIAVGIAKELWNQFGGAMLGLWSDDDDLEGQLSEADRRRPHLLLGRDAKGQVMVVYTPSAFGDVAEWVGGNNAKRLLAEYLKGDITLDMFIADYAKQVPPDMLNKLAQSIGPAGKVPYEAISGKAVFPDVLDQRTIPDSDRWWRMVGTATDDRSVNWLRGIFDADYYSQPASEQLQQMILQIRRRDPLMWNYYEAREDAADWKERRTGKRFEQGSYNAPEAQVLRNFRRAIYRGDIPQAHHFYQRLLAYGYTKERFDASLRNQDPLSDLNAQERRIYEAQLDERGRRELKLAREYYARLKNAKSSYTFPKKPK